MVYIGVDEYRNRKLLTEGQILWLEHHRNDLQRWLHENLKDIIDMEMLESDIFDLQDEIKAYLFYLFLKQKMVTYEDKIWEICQRVAKQDGALTMIIAPKRYGKTALMYFIAEFCHKNFGTEIWWFGPPTELPPFVKNSTMNYDELPQDVLVLMDELAIKFFNRNFANTEQKDIIRKLPVASHTGRNILATLQDADIVDVGLLRMATAFIFLGKSVVSLKKERLVFNPYLEYFMPSHVGEALFFDGKTMLNIKYPLPKWWGETYSKPFRKFLNKAEQYRFILEMLNDGMSNEVIIDYLGMRATRMSEIEIEFIRRFIQLETLEKVIKMSDDKLTSFIDAGFSDLPVNEMIIGKKKNIKYNFKQDPLVYQYWQNKFKKDPEIELKMKMNVNKILIDYIKKIRKHDHVLISIRGATGSGKSLASISIAECIGNILKKPFNAKNVFFTPDEMIKNMKRMKKYDTVILDEQVRRSGYASHKERGDLSNIEQTLRAEQINFIFNAPTLHTHLHRFILEPYAIDEINEVAKLVVYLPDETVFGHITLSRPTSKTEEHYKNLKKKFTTAVKEQDPSISSPAVSTLEGNAKRVMTKYPNWFELKTTQRNVAIVEVCGCGVDNAKLIRAHIEMNEGKYKKEN